MVVRSLEDNLPIDFGCVCLYDAASTHAHGCEHRREEHALAAAQLRLEPGAHCRSMQNGLSRCVQGELVYEPDIARVVSFPFPQRLAAAGLRSLVAAPLLVESQVFGVLLAARREAQSFSSGDCEFLRQLSEHVALAAHQAQLYDALQQAYDDLRQTQQARDAAGAAAGARPDGERHRARHQQRDFAGGALHRVAAGDGNRS